MPTLISVLIGVATTLLAAAIVAYLVQRRLCLLLEVLPTSELADQGKTLLLSILNRSRKPESVVTIELDNSLRYTLIATSTTSLSLRDNTLHIETLPPKEKVSAVVVAEGGDVTTARIIRIVSNDTRGKVYTDLALVPQVPGVSAFAALAIGLLMSGPAIALYFISKDVREGLTRVSTEAYGLTDEQRARVKALDDAGWRNTKDFIESELSQHYPEGIFPVTATPISRIGDLIYTEVVVENRDMKWFSVTVHASSPAPSPTDPCLRTVEHDSEFDLVVPAGAKKTFNLMIYLPDSGQYGDQIIRAEASFKTFDGSVIYGPWRGLVAGHLTNTPLPARYRKDFPCLIPWYERLQTAKKAGGDAAKSAAQKPKSNNNK